MVCLYENIHIDLYPPILCISNVYIKKSRRKHLCELPQFQILIQDIETVILHIFKCLPYHLSFFNLKIDE